MASTSGWARAVVVRRGGTSSQLNSRASSSAPQVQSTSSTTFGGGVKDPSGRVKEFSHSKADDDQCPVCKSDRYLNPKLRLLVSACYHKMCESCIDRLFTLGPAPCPICNKTLRKLAFTPQTFEDLSVEKEVAVRRRIHREFNKRKEDFVDLRSYNDYLEDIENIAFNLINDIDVAETEARIAAMRAENAAITELNIQRDQQAAQLLLEEEERQKSEREERARELRMLEAQEREEIERSKVALINDLERSSGDAAKVVAKSRAEAQKRMASQRPIPQTTSSARLLRTRAQAHSIPDVPHVPITDQVSSYDDQITIKDQYVDPVSELVRKDSEGIMRAGGYRVEEAWGRALRTALAGLDIMPLDDIGLRDDIIMTSS